VTLIKNIYINTVTCIGECDDESDVFSINIVSHQILALSPSIFTLVMNEIINDIQGDIL
jgi:hypothetical protein